MNELLLRRNKLLLNSSKGGTNDIDGKYMLAFDYRKPINISRDYGNTWALTNNITKGCFRGGISSTGQYMVGMKQKNVVCISKDYGVTWVAKNLKKNLDSIGISGDGRHITVLVTNPTSFYISNDYGDTFTSIPTDFTGFLDDIEISFDGTYQNGNMFSTNDYWNTNYENYDVDRCTYTGMSNDGKFRVYCEYDAYISNDYGVSAKIVWPSTSAYTFNGCDISDNGRVIVFIKSDGADDFFVISKDGGATWNEKLINANNGIKISSNGQHIIASLYASTKTFISNDYGETFIEKPISSYNSLAINRYYQ